MDLVNIEKVDRAPALGGRGGGRVLLHMRDDSISHMDLT